MYPNQLVAIVQIVAVMMCTAVAMGMLLSVMMVRGKLYATGPGAAQHDIAFTEKAYLGASIFCGLGAIAAINLSWGTFAAFIGFAVALQLADHLLVPRMRKAAAEGQPLPMTGTRWRFELIAACGLLMMFWKTAVPPLVTLAVNIGIG